MANRTFFLALPMLVGCAIPYEPTQGTFEVTPHERAGGTCGSGHAWVETIDEHSSKSGHSTIGDIDWTTLRYYDVPELRGYAEQRGVYHERFAGLPEQPERVLCESQYDLVLKPL